MPAPLAASVSAVINAEEMLPQHPVPVWPVLENSFNALDDNDHEDPDEDDAAMLDALLKHEWPGPSVAASIPSKTAAKMPPLKSFKPRRHEKLTPEVIDEVVRRIEEGLLKLPKVAPTSVWALMDSGAAPNIACRDKHFPGAKVRPSEAQKQGQLYQAANGQHFAIKGNS